MSNQKAWKVPDEVLLQSVVDWRKVHEHWPTLEDHESDPNLPNPHICEQRFGGLGPMREAARIFSNQITLQQKADITEARINVLRQLQKTANYLTPRRLTLHSLKAVPRQLRPSISDISRYCGGLNAAMRMLGLVVPFPTAEDLVQALCDAAFVLDRPLVLEDCGTEALPYARSCFDRTFPSWRAAMAAADLKPRIGRPKSKNNLSDGEAEECRAAKHSAA